MRKVCTIAAILLTLCTAADSVSAQSGLKSPAKAFFSSLLLPGWGQHYTENGGGVRFFAVTEALLIGGALGHEEYSSWLEEDYRAYAVEHAGIDPNGKDKNYFIEISKYNSIYLYNEKARINREFESVIPETPGNIWVWDSAVNRVSFHYMRVDADKIENRSTYFWTGVFLNHLISGIHAALMAKRYNENLQPASEPKLTARAVSRIHGPNPRVALQLNYRF